jgi:hypothetical protein
MRLMIGTEELDVAPGIGVSDSSPEQAYRSISFQTACLPCQSPAPEIQPIPERKLLDAGREPILIDSNQVLHAPLPHLLEEARHCVFLEVL